MEMPEVGGAAAPAAAPSTGWSSRPAASNEPVLRIDDIQGNVLAGFNKDWQALLFLEIVDAAAFRSWLGGVVDEVATAAEVLAFNQLFKAVGRRRRREPPLRAAWFNLGFSAAGLEQLGAPIAEFADEGFRSGLAIRSSLLGDPVQGAPGSPPTWCVGGPGKEADVVLVLAADSGADLRDEVGRLAPRWRQAGDSGDGARLLHADNGAALPPPATGHEHFGFKDGISQPGVRGRISEDATDLLTLRQNRFDANQGKPGQDLIWPGQFVFGYPGQDRMHDDPQLPGHDSLVDAQGNRRAPDWARDGSFLVVRRLLQDVQGFRRFVAETAKQVGVCEGLLAAKLLGRWASGAPLRTAPAADDGRLADDDCRNNDFVYGDRAAATAPGGASDPLVCAAARPALAADPDGKVCPLAAHIRKMNPRDDVSRFAVGATPADTRTRRILRRGVPFGPPAARSGEATDRGLLFLAYQTSIVEQFEFLQRQWANFLEFDNITRAGEFSAGHDPIVGRDAGSPSGPRRFQLRLDQPQRDVVLELPAWVLPTGGGYFFCPAIPVLARLAAGGLGATP